MISLTATAILPGDAEAAALVGRVWLPAADGPSVVTVLCPAAREGADKG